MWLLFLYCCVFHHRLKTGTKVLEEHAKKARKLQGERLSVENFAQILYLPVTDTLKQVHSMFDQVNASLRLPVQKEPFQRHLPLIGLCVNTCNQTYT